MIFAFRDDRHQYLLVMPDESRAGDLLVAHPVPDDFSLRDSSHLLNAL
jgi:hypothetical protein